jgi:CRISPR/Cas system-associated endonuclease Cas1
MCIRRAISLRGGTLRSLDEIVEHVFAPIGVLHGRESERGAYPAFALDRMEPTRPVVDRAVLQLVAATTFAGG